MIEFEFEQTKGNWNEILLYSLNKSPWYTLEKKSVFFQVSGNMENHFHLCVCVCWRGGMDDTRRTWPIKSTKQGTHELTELKQQAQGLYQVLMSMLQVLAWCLCGTPDSRNGWCLTLLPALRTPFLLFGYLVQL